MKEENQLIAFVVLLLGVNIFEAWYLINYVL